MEVYLFSKGESTTDVAKWSFERQGFKVNLLLDEDTTFSQKYEEFLNLAKGKEWVIRSDADIIVNRNFRKFAEAALAKKWPNIWWWRSRTFCFHQWDTIIGTPKILKKEAIDVGQRFKDNFFRNEMKPETAFQNQKEFIGRFNNWLHQDFNIVGFHGYRQYDSDIARVLDQKRERGQIEEWDSRLIKRIENFYPYDRDTRRWSNDELRKFAELFVGDVVNVSAWEDKDKQGGFYKDYFVNAKSYAVTNYVGERAGEGISLDLTKDLKEELINRFDVVFNHTTLEHIYKVSSAFKNLCLMSKDIVILVVPFLQDYHRTLDDSYLDYWRFTKDALKNLFEDNGMKMLYISESPGRIKYFFAIGSKKPELWENKI
jgi:hypothetical protein